MSLANRINGRRVCLHCRKGTTIYSCKMSSSIFGDPAADSEGEGKSKRAGKYGTKKSKERPEEPLGTMPYQISSKTVAANLASDWAEKHKSFLAPIRSQNGGDRLELVW